MAKNMLQAKKRVSHFQKTHKDFGGENELFECNDFVSSIIFDMDSNFSNIKSGYSKSGFESNEAQITMQDIPLLQMPGPSHQKTSQILPKCMKTKKFSCSRKFPLMEKSQKILKQLKHNQNFPKPRAHLAGLPKSPAKSKAKFISKISVGKKKVLNVKNKIVHNPLCEVPSSHSANLNIKSSNLNRISNNDLASKHSMSKKVEDNTIGKSSFRDVLATADINTETNSKREYDSDTSDSEFERFIKKQKKDLPTKSSKKRKQNSRKSKSSTKTSKGKKLVHVSEQKTVNDCDNLTKSSRNVKTCSLKQAKDAPVITDFKDDSNCSDLDDIPDWSTRVLSSESDDDSVVTSVTDQKMSKTCESKSIGETVLSVQTNSTQPLSILGSNNSDLVKSNNETEFGNSLLDLKSTGKSEAFSGTNLHPSCQNLSISELNIKSDQVQSEFVNETLIKSIKVEKNSLPSNIVIDICDSEDECENVERNASELNCKNVFSSSIENKTNSMADPDTDESDIEVVEVIKHVQTVNKGSTSVLANNPDSLNVATREKKLVTENECIDVKPSIKTEILGHKTILHLGKDQKEAEFRVKSDVSHSEMILEHKTTVGSQYSKITQNMPLRESSQPSMDLAVVKHELGSDDDIVILDSVHSTKVDVSNVLSVKLEKIKPESSTSENKLKSLDSIDSEPRTDDTNDWEAKFQNVIPVSSAELLQWYKMEFETLMEMKQANADVEASLKNIQARQREKMLYVRDLLYKCVKSNEDSKTLKLQQGENPEDVKNLNTVNAQYDCDSSPNNSFSINTHKAVSPSTVVLDIKPDVKLEEEMQPVAIKSEIQSGQENYSRNLIPKIESDDKQTLKLLNEKCSVCNKDAVAACQKCAKVFFCSHECGKKFWIEGHVKVCGSK